MRLTYSPQVDAPGLRLAPGAQTIDAREIAPGTFADFNKDGRLLGIEVLEASAFYDQACSSSCLAPRASLSRRANAA